MLMPSKISSMFNAAVGIQERYFLRTPSHQHSRWPADTATFPLLPSLVLANPSSLGAMDEPPLG